MTHFKWRTRDGQVIPLGEMTESHLRNTISYLHRRADELDSSYWAAGSMLRGEFAVDAWESAMSGVVDQVEHLNAVAELMKKELERRA
jgi:hypothetical protein